VVCGVVCGVVWCVLCCGVLWCALASLCGRWNDRSFGKQLCDLVWMLSCREGVRSRVQPSAAPAILLSLLRVATAVTAQLSEGGATTAATEEGVSSTHRQLRQAVTALVNLAPASRDDWLCESSAAGLLATLLDTSTGTIMEPLSALFFNSCQTPGVAVQVARARNFQRLCGAYRSGRLTPGGVTNVARLFHCFSQLPRSVIPHLMRRCDDGQPPVLHAMVAMCAPSNASTHDLMPAVIEALNAINKFADHGALVSNGVLLRDLLVQGGAVTNCVYHTRAITTGKPYGSVMN